MIAEAVLIETFKASIKGNVETSGTRSAVRLPLKCMRLVVWRWLKRSWATHQPT